MKFSYSRDEENYHGDFDTIDAACQEASHEVEAGQYFWVAEQAEPVQPEEYWHTSDWLENVSCQDSYSCEWCEDWDASTKEQREELEKEVRAVMAAWLDRHKLRPAFFEVENPKRFLVAKTGDGYVESPEAGGAS